MWLLLTLLLLFLYAATIPECLVLMDSQDTFVQVREGRDSEWHREMGELR